MSTVADRLHKWAVQELHLASEAGCVPDVEYFRGLTTRKNKKMWVYVISHVRNQATVNKIKRILFYKKLMQGREEAVTCGDSNDVQHLQSAISKATDKRKYLLKSLSTVKERLLNLEQDLQAKKDETFLVKQKTALLEHLIKLYDEKETHLKNLASQILSHKAALRAFQSVKTCDKSAMALPSDFLFRDKTVYSQNYSKVQHLISTCCALYENNFHLRNENSNVLIENFENNMHELKKNNVHLMDFVILLKEICNSDLQYFASVNLQSSSVMDYLQNAVLKSQSKTLLKKLKCDCVTNSFKTIQNRECIEKTTAAKNEIFECRIKSSDHNNLNCEIGYTLFDKMVENHALVVSNRCLEDYMTNISDKTECVLKNIRQQKFCSEELNSVIQKFHSSSDLTFCLLYTFPNASEETFGSLNSLQTFAYTELFESPLPQKESILQLKNDLISDRNLMWAYCKKSDTFQPLFSELFTGNFISSLEMQKSLNYQSFQNVSSLCENLVRSKRTISSELIAHAEMYALSSDTNAPEIYSKFLAMLGNTKTSFEKAVLCINDGTTLCQKINALMQEWWEQGAQYVPPIEYEGKTLKMWIDILSVLSDFEPENCV